jgi:hypothetical protein
MTNEFIVFVEFTSISKMTQELTYFRGFPRIRGKSAALLEVGMMVTEKYLKFQSNILKRV